VQPTAESLLASASERCANHPERAATLTCARCGSFGCEACRSTELVGHCAPCAERLARARLVGHVPIFGIVMMVHGLLTAGLGLYYGVFGTFFAGNIFSLEPDPSREPHPADDLFPGIMLGTFLVLSVLQLVPGILQVWAGYRARSFRSRGLAVAALIVGLLPALGCYCGPTGLALLVWGLIVLRDPDVRARFAATEASAT
jgi:hypothetical protein